MAESGYHDAGSGPPVLLLGGPYPADLLRARPAPALHAAGFRTVTVCLRDLAPAGRRDATVSDLADDVAGLLDRLGVRRCGVVGDFLGADVTVELCLSRPDLVGAAVFSAPRTAPSRLCAAVHEEVLARIDSGEPIGADALALIRALQLFSPARLTDDEAFRADLRMLAGLPVEDKGDVEVIRASAGYRLSPLDRLTVPSLVIGYEHDAICPPFQAREFAGRLPDADLRVLPLGHGGLFEDPGQVIGVAAGHLNRASLVVAR